RSQPSDANPVQVRLQQPGAAIRIRLSFSGRVGRTAGAYGLQYGGIFPVTFQQLRWDPPNFQKLEVQVPELANPLAHADLGPTARSTIFEVPPTLRSPYSHQYNFTWDIAPGSAWKLQLGYVGSRTAKLFMIWFNNRAAPAPGIDTTIDTIELRRPNKQHFEI